MFPRVGAFVAVLLLVLSGCLTFGGTPRPDYTTLQDEIHEEALRVLVQSSDHDHFDARIHAGGRNLDLVAYHNGIDDSGDPDAIPGGGFYTELAVTANYVYLARHSTDGSYSGFSILRIDVDGDGLPALHHTGHFPAPGGADIQVSHDERFVFFATQRNSVEELAGNMQTYQEPTLPRGIYIVDVSDKANPRQSSFTPLPVNGPHTMSYHMHQNGNEYLFVSTYDLLTDPGTGAILGTLPVTQRVLVYQVVRDPLDNRDAALASVAQYQILESPRDGKLFFPHDAVPQYREDMDRTFLYVAYWDKGLQILDITDLPDVGSPLSLTNQPQHVSGYTEFSPSAFNNIHQARPFPHFIDGRHVTVTQPEIISGDETGYIFFLDTTDPDDPRRLGHWTLPGDLVVQMLEFSPHNFDTWDGKVALAHNHAGLWILDASDEENLRDPKTVAYYMPAKPRQDSPRPQPYVWGVFQQEVDGRSYLFASDEATGVHVLRYTGP